MHQETPPVKLHHFQWKMLHASFDWIVKPLVPPKKVTTYRAKQNPHFIVTWIQKGEVYKRIPAQSLKAYTGEWLIQQPGEQQTTTLQPGLEHIEVGFSMEWLGSGQMFLPPKQTLWKTGPLPELEEKTIRLYRFISDQDPMRSRNFERMNYDVISMNDHMLYTHLFYDWLATWESNMRKVGMGWQHVENIDTKVLDVALHLENHPLHLPISVQEMARNIGMSKVHLTHLFRKTYRTTPKAYRLKLKLKKALHELKTTRRELKEIAAGLGYSQSWFSIWIKQETGKTPSEIRSENL